MQFHSLDKIFFVPFMQHFENTNVRIGHLDSSLVVTVNAQFLFVSNEETLEKAAVQF
jgi:ABC-type uncharacterized transport system permease subunit